MSFSVLRVDEPSFSALDFPGSMRVNWKVLRASLLCWGAVSALDFP